MRKWIFIGLAVVVLAVGVGAALAVANLNSYLEQNRDWLAAQAEAAIGREVAFDRIGVSFMGGLGVEITGLEVGDDPAFSPDPFLKADEVMVIVRLWPAIMGSYEVEKVALMRPDITLLQTAAGSNTDSLGASSPPAATPGAPTQSSDAPPPMIVIALADIRDGRIRLLDTSGEQPVEIIVEQLDVEVANVSLVEPVDFEVAAAILGSQTQNLAMKGRVGPFDSEAPAQSPLELELTLDQLAAEQLVRSPLLVGSLPSELSVQGLLDVRATLSGTTGALAVQAFIDARDAAVKYAELLDKPVGTALDFALEGKLQDDAFQITSSTLKLDRATVATVGTIALADPLAYDLKLSSQGLPLEGWEQQLPSLAGLGLAGSTDLDLKVSGNMAQAGLPKLDGTAKLQAVGARLEGVPPISGLSSLLTLAGGGVKMSASRFELGGEPVTLAASVADLEKPVVVFDLSASQLTGKALGLGDDSGLEVLRDLSMSGTASSNESGPSVRATLQSGSGRAAGFDYQQLAAKLRYAGSVAKLESLNFQSYQGAISASGSYDMSKPNDPSFDMKATLRGMRLEAFAASQFGEGSDVLEGALDSDLTLAGRGADADVIKRTLTGNGRMEVADGLIRDINIVETALQSVTGVPGLTNMISPRVRERHPGVFSTGDTVFDTMKGMLDIRDGKMLVKDMKVSAKDYSLKAGGTVGLDSSVNIAAMLTTSRELTQDLVGESKAVRYITGPSGTIEIPVNLGGTLTSLKAQPDVSQLTSRAAQNAASTALVDLLNKKLGKQNRNDGSDAPAAPDSPTSPTQQGPRDPDSQTQEPAQPVDPLEELIIRSIGDLL